MPDMPVKFSCRQCPSCGYRIADTAWKMALFDFPCPRCGNCDMSEFRALEDLDLETLKDIQGAK